MQARGKRLPSKLSELLTLALNDLNKTEKDKRYQIDMSDWHTPHAKACYVCLSGAVMAQTLKASPSLLKVPYHFDRVNNRKLVALELLRHGDVAGAVWVMKLPAMKEIQFNRNITQYSYDPRKFKLQMRALARALKGAGY